MHVRVRGVYSTAITKLLLDNGISVSHTSKKIRERFSLEDTKEPPTVTIKDANNKHGVVVVGEFEHGKAIYSLLREKIDCICWVSKLPLHSIIKGRVVDTNDGKSIIDLGRYKGIIDKKFEVGSEVLVDVARPFMPHENYAKLSDKYTIYGKYVALIHKLSSKVIFSRHITSKRLRGDLTSLATMLNVENWGVKWRSSAVLGEFGEMIKDFQQTLSRAEEIMKKAENCEVGDIVYDGEFFAIFSFTKEGKEFLDNIRNRVLPTIPGHHSLKSMNESEIVEFAEHIVKSGMVSEKKVSEIVFDYIKNLMQENLISIYHISLLTGGVKNLTPGKLIGIKGGTFRLKRVFRGRGIFDGLGVKKSPGDYDIMEFSQTLPMILHKYYGKNGEFKGVYININTPPEISRNAIRYIDFEIDVVADNENVKIIDSELLDKACELGIINDNVKNHFAELAEKIKDKILSFEDLQNLSLEDLTAKK